MRGVGRTSINTGLIDQLWAKVEVFVPGQMVWKMNPFQGNMFTWSGSVLVCLGPWMSGAEGSARPCLFVLFSGALSE